MAHTLQNPKVFTRDQLVAALAGFAGRVGYTSGVFDLLHVGHVRYLQAARARCDRLIVGVNSDSSVRQLKGPKRPLVPGTERAEVIAGLSCVDAVFLFDEINNQENIRLLRPAVYLKAGDYGREKLSSAGIVESYGGTVEIVPFVAEKSSTGLIDRILDRHMADWLLAPSVSEPRPALFVDRDGTLIEHIEYLSDPKKVQLLPGVGEALRRFQAAGYRIIVVTNQPGIGLGYFSLEDFFRVNRAFLTQIRAEGIQIDKVYFCPHSEAEGCHCRKPDQGLIERAFSDLALDRSRSLVVGDSTMDIELGARAGLTTVLVPTGVAGADGRFMAQPTYRLSLLEAAERILGGG